MAARRCATASHLAAGLTIFLQELLQRRRLQDLVGEQLLQLRVLVFRGLQTLGVGHVHPAILRLPVIQGRLADRVLARKIARLRNRLVLAQNRNDLVLR